MGISFFPTPADVDRYRRLRAVSRNLCDNIVKTIPRRAYDEIGEALGVLRNGVVVFETEDMPSVMADSCIFDWFEDGKNLVQRYAETHPARSGTDEAYLLDAYRQARYGIITVESTVHDAGVYCYDALNKEELFVMDRAFSRSLADGGVMAARRVPLGEYWMTTGAALPVVSAQSLEPTVRQLEQGLVLEVRNGPAPLSTMIIRACLDAGAAEYIAYEGPATRPKLGPRMPSWPGSKRKRRLS